jgi:sulfatase maturation enzyme AslB (radical SAM superfamily)
MKDAVISEQSLLQSVDRGYEQDCRSLVISGGEPTLLPSGIINIMEYADSLGYESFTLQTNGSGLANKNELLKYLQDIAGRRELAISFSIHGANSSIHDAMSSKDGAFSDLMQAMKHVASIDSIAIYTNTVISALNIYSLREIAALISPFHVNVMQFSVLHSDSEDGLSVDLLTCAKTVCDLANIVGKEILRTEGIPYCLLYGNEMCVGESYWPPQLDLFNNENDYMSDFDQLSAGMRKKAFFCSECIMSELCHGVWSENYTELLNNAKPIR